MLSVKASMLAAAAIGGALVVIAETGSVAPEKAHCKLGGDFYASIVDTPSGEVITHDNISVSRDEKSCLLYVGNDFIRYEVR